MSTGRRHFPRPYQFSRWTTIILNSCYHKPHVGCGKASPHHAVASSCAFTRNRIDVAARCSAYIAERLYNRFNMIVPRLPQ